MRDTKDRSGKWLIEHHGDGLLRLGGVHGFRSWRAAPNEVVLPKQAPDGLLEVFFPDQPRADLFLVEIETYPEREHEQQVLDDLTLVLGARGALPEVISLILQPRGQFRVVGRQAVASRLGYSQVEFRWKVVELWTLEAADLLAANDVGLIPLVPLTHYDGSPAALIEECRQRIESQASPAEQDNLLAVTQVMARLAYNDWNLLNLLVRSRAMIKSPIFDELRAQTAQRLVTNLLEARFGPVPPEIAMQLQAIIDENRLTELNRDAAFCSNLEAFRAKLSANGETRHGGVEP
jgi:hypothetical protein